LSLIIEISEDKFITVMHVEIIHQILTLFKDFQTYTAN